MNKTDAIIIISALLIWSISLFLSKPDPKYRNIDAADAMEIEYTANR